MTNRSDGHDDELVRALDELFADDVFLTELSRGVDVSDGEDPLADLFLALRDEVESDIPPAPALADLGIDDSDEYFDDDYDDQLTATDVFVAIDEDDFDDDDDLDDSEFDDEVSDDDLVDSEEDADDDQSDDDDDDADNVIDLDSRRRWGLGRIASGLIGAAAATLVLAGAGGAVISAQEGSPFYGLHQKLFGESWLANLKRLPIAPIKVMSRVHSSPFKRPKRLWTSFIMDKIKPKRNRRLTIRRQLSPL